MVTDADARYLQIAEELKQSIACLGPNTLLPTENDLAAKFNVSRATIRNALSLLEQVGAVTRTRGRGTVVNPPKVVRNNIPMCTLEDDFRQQGIDFQTRILAFEPSTDAPAEIRERLRIAPRERVGSLSLLRVVDGHPICFEQRYCIGTVAAKLSPEAVLSRAVVDVLGELASAPIETVEFDTEIHPSDRRVAASLNLRPGTLVLRNSFTYFLPNARPIEAGSLSYRVDRCKFRARGHFHVANPREAKQPP